jgi:hypothetical protein
MKRRLRDSGDDYTKNACRPRITAEAPGEARMSDAGGDKLKQENIDGRCPVRRMDGCVNCGEIREIAAHGLCFRCYRTKERAGDGKQSAVDRHNPGIRREHKKLFRGFTSVMVGLSDLGISKNDVLTIRQMIEPYLSPIATFLAVKSQQQEGEVNGEQESQGQFTVHGLPGVAHQSPVDSERSR